MDISLCVRFQVFVFDVGGKTWMFYNWTMVTTLAMFGKYDPELMFYAHSKGARVVLKGTEMFSFFRSLSWCEFTHCLNWSKSAVSESLSINTQPFPDLLFYYYFEPFAIFSSCWEAKRRYSLWLNEGDVLLSSIVDQKQRTAWITEKVNLAKSQFMDGINIDLEQKVERDSPEYYALTDLVKETAEAFHKEIPGSQVNR